MQLASTTDKILQEVFDMIEELALTIPHLESCKITVSMTTDMETALLSLYQEFICFYARTIRFFRNFRQRKYCVLRLNPVFVLI